MDGRDFIQSSLERINNHATWLELNEFRIQKQEAIHKRKGTKMKPWEAPRQKFRQFDHYIMNLPATAVEFLGNSYSF